MGYLEVVHRVDKTSGAQTSNAYTTDGLGGLLDLIREHRDDDGDITPAGVVAVERERERLKVRAANRERETKTARRPKGTKALKPTVGTPSSPP